MDIATQYAYYNRNNIYPTPGHPYIRLYQINFVGLESGKDAVISQYEKEEPPECPNHVKAGWLYQPSKGVFLNVEDFKKDPDRYKEDPESIRGAMTSEEIRVIIGKQ